MKRLALAFPLLLMSGCCGGETVSADCPDGVRYGGTTYYSAGLTTVPATEVGVGEQAECDDVGCAPKGVHFPDDPREVTVWAFERQAAGEVLGTRLEDGTFLFYLPEDTAPARRDAIIAALAGR